MFYFSSGQKCTPWRAGSFLLPPTLFFLVPFNRLSSHSLFSPSVFPCLRWLSSLRLWPWSQLDSHKSSALILFSSLIISVSSPVLLHFVCDTVQVPFAAHNLVLLCFHDACFLIPIRPHELLLFSTCTWVFLSNLNIIDSLTIAFLITFALILHSNYYYLKLLTLDSSLYRPTTILGEVPGLALYKFGSTSVAVVWGVIGAVRQYGLHWEAKAVVLEFMALSVENLLQILTE